MCYKKLIRPLLFLADAEFSHHLTLKILHYYGRFTKPAPVLHNPISIMGLNFPNRIGLAAGLDKNAVAIDAFAAMGFGFIEVGTVTPRAQPGNPKPRLFRLTKQQALINRFGFNNVGVDEFVANVKASRYQGILGINIGKNAATTMENATADYLICLEKVYPHASYITINISSPNTKNLRDLQHGEELRNLLQALKEKQFVLSEQYRKYVPLVVKLSPDLSPAEVTATAETLLAAQIDGVIVSNTTSSRTEIADSEYAQEQGGLSGSPLFNKSLNLVKQLAELFEHRIPIIGCGGISSVDDARAMLAAGADVIQVYTAFIYQGPELVKEIAHSV